MEGLAPTLYSPEPVTVSSSHAGVLTLPEWTNIQGGYSGPEGVLAEPTMPPEVASALSHRIVTPQRTTFTSKGQVHTIEVHQGMHEAVPDGMPLWFDARWANWYSSNKLPSTRRRAWRRYLIHQDGNDWVERFEPIDDAWTTAVKGTDAFLGARSWIYVHWQLDKRSVSILLREDVDPDLMGSPTSTRCKARRRISLLASCTSATRDSTSPGPCSSSSRITEGGPCRFEYRAGLAGDMIH